MTVKTKGKRCPRIGGGGGNSAAPQFWDNVSQDFWETLPRFSVKRFPKFVGNVTPESEVTFPRVCLIMKSTLNLQEMIL